MDAAGFAQMLRRLTPAELAAIAAAVEVDPENGPDEVEAWRITITIDRVLREHHRSRLAAHAASVASRAVLAAAEAHGLELPDARVTVVARAAAEVARALVAGDDAHYEAELLLVPFAALADTGTAAA
jgi:hypothetical protein